MDQFIHPLIGVANECLKAGKWEDAKKAYQSLMTSDASDFAKNIGRTQLNKMQHYETVSSSISDDLKDKFPGMKLEILDLKDINKIKDIENLIPHTDEEYEELKKDVETFGVKVPIIVNKGMDLIDGYRRYGVSKELNLSYVPVFIVDIPKKDAVVWAVKLNTIRRQLGSETKLSLINKVIEWSGSIKKGRPVENNSVDRVKIKDIADVVGVSKSTVDRAIAKKSKKIGEQNQGLPKEKTSRDVISTKMSNHKTADDFIKSLKMGDKKKKYDINLETDWDTDQALPEAEALRCIQEVINKFENELPDIKKVVFAIHIEAEV